MTDRNKELVPDSWSLEIRERALHEHWTLFGRMVFCSEVISLLLIT